MIDDEMRDVINKSARGAGDILLNYYSQDLRMEMKDEINPVTIADTESEKFIIETIQARFPEHSILAEERPEIETESDYLWVIDPLDGTTNYAHQFPLFCVSIALHHKGKPLLGVIYEPLRDEFFYGESGGGATLNDEQISVSDVESLKRAFLTTGFAYDVHSSAEDNVDNFRAFLKRALAIRRGGSAALDLAYVACGRFDGFWEMKLHPWDTAVGILLVEEAGGEVTKFNSEPFSIYDVEILATNGLIHDEMVSVLREVGEES